MTAREKFLSVLEPAGATHAPNWEFGYWLDTLVRWYGEGLPSKRPPVPFDQCQWIPAQAVPSPDFFTDEGHYEVDAAAFFGFDERARCVGLDMGPRPCFPEEMRDDDGVNLTKRTYDGKWIRTRRDGTSMPMYLAFPVQNRQDFEGIRHRFLPSDDRLAPTFDRLCHRYSTRSFPLQLGGGAYSGFFSVLRELMGLEGALFGFFDDPDLVRAILDHFHWYYLEMYRRVLARTDVDFVLFWEDLSYKNGPLLSPDLFRAFILPHYEALIQDLRALGVRHFLMDTDGRFEVLLPMLVEAGLTGFYPFEAAAGMDVAEVRRQYPDLAILGSVDKRLLAGDRADLAREMRRISELYRQGRFLPFTDHMVPPDVGFDAYRRFREGLSELLG